MPASEYVRNLRARVGQELIMFPTVSAVVLNDRGEVLLHQRSDTGQWTLIAGMMDPGEQPADTVVREVAEETAVQVEIERLAGVVSHDVTYPNGDRCQMVNMCFRCRAVGGEARVNDTESLAVGWFPLDAMPAINPFAGKLLAIALDEGDRPYFAAPGQGGL
ncbi:NUDIX hydrolase [Actinoplanes teichomyceticus]|uniref:ADP-ribose pyrophosphatase YjhB (NUDIX family) n=1 Tax=Actinoplanes teichomyceticus TaxID=1867 RepID=A0A561WJP8_ACTTI|nr:NUDIX domain-containing protein [Actinoplanes teichomyceticus]TWG24075.1 ADP-ribose pyrophosphatase YjhB (NUDIX family) [Actinoplanes teichomyceticus]GIF12115.1 NUDIX hydrolase [Actinoplanes teichomyceticus]